MKWIPVCVEAVPDFIPRHALSDHHPTARGELKRQGYRPVGSYCSRNATMWVPRRWYWYVRLELFLAAAICHAFRFLIRQRILVGPEGGWLYEFHFNDPAAWRWK